MVSKTKCSNEYNKIIIVNTHELKAISKIVQ